MSGGGGDVALDKCGDSSLRAVRFVQNDTRFGGRTSEAWSVLRLCGIVRVSRVVAVSGKPAVPIENESGWCIRRELSFGLAQFSRRGPLTPKSGGRINRAKSFSGGATLHTETAAHASSFPHLIHELHANCPTCGRLIDIPAAAVHSDGTGRGYCATCRTELFDASAEN